MTLIKCAASVLLSAAVLSGCGGEGDASSVVRNGEGGLFFGFFQEARSSTDTNPRNIGGLYLSVPSSNGFYFGRASFQFNPVCQRINTLPILGDKVASSLTGAAGGPLDGSDEVVFGMPAVYFFDGRSYGGNYARLNVTSNQNRLMSECDNTYNLAPSGAWVTHIQGTRFPADFTIRQTSTDQVTWLSPDSVTSNRALIMLLDADILKKPTTPGVLPENAIISQVIQAIPAKRPDQPNVLNTYNLPPQSIASKEYVVVVQLLNARGQLVAFDDLTVRF